MADPVIVKVSDLTELTDLASGDLITIVDISEVVVSSKTKKLQAQNLKVFNANQLGANVVAQAAIANSAVSSDKLATGAVTAGKIATGGVSASAQLAAQVVDTAALKDANVTVGKMAANSIDSDQYVDGSIDTVHLADDAVTEAKLGAIKRTVAIPIFGLEDDIFVKNFSRVFAWPPTLNGHLVTGAHAAILGSVSSSGSIGITLTNQNGTMSTISIGARNWSASGSINSSYRTAQSFATFSVNVTAAGSGAKGLTIFLEVTG